MPVLQEFKERKDEFLRKFQEEPQEAIWIEPWTLNHFGIERLWMEQHEQKSGLGEM